MAAIRTGLSGFHISTAMLRPMLAGLRSLGADVEALARHAELPLEALARADARVPFEAPVRLCVEAARALGDPALGLHLAELYRPGVFGVLDYLARSSRTLREALLKLCRYNRLLQDATETILEEETGRSVVWQRSLGPILLPPVVTEYALANLVVAGRHLASTRLTPLGVEFRHPAPPHVAEHARVFGAPVRFGAERDALVLRAQDLDQRLTSADEGLCSILDRHAEQLLAGVPRLARFAARVRELVAAEIQHGGATVDRIAHRLQMSERTLRRRLKADGTTFEELVDGLRRALAERYLDDRRMSLERIALLVGYSEASAFRRAFRRWHGVSPARYRDQRRGAAQTSRAS